MREEPRPSGCFVVVGCGAMVFLGLLALGFAINFIKGVFG